MFLVWSFILIVLSSFLSFFFCRMLSSNFLVCKMRTVIPPLLVTRIKLDKYQNYQLSSESQQFNRLFDTGWLNTFWSWTILQIGIHRLIKKCYFFYIHSISTSKYVGSFYTKQVSNPLHTLFIQTNSETVCLALPSETMN